MPTKFFLSELACQRHDALSSNGAVLILQSTANLSDVTIQPLQSLLNSVGAVESVFFIFGIPDLTISHSLFPYKHGAKTPQKSVFSLFQINFFSLLFHFVQVNCQMLVNVFWLKKEKRWFCSLKAFRFQLCLKHEHYCFIIGLTFERNERKIF